MARARPLSLCIARAHTGGRTRQVGIIEVGGMQVGLVEIEKTIETFTQTEGGVGMAFGGGSGGRWRGNSSTGTSRRGGGVTGREGAGAVSGSGGASGAPMFDGLSLVHAAVAAAVVVAAVVIGGVVVMAAIAVLAVVVDVVLRGLVGLLLVRQQRQDKG